MEATESKDKETHKRNYGKIVLTLENALLPAEKLEKDTISQQDGLSKEIEMDLRILGCELIQTAGILLKLPQVRSESDPRQRKSQIRAMFAKYIVELLTYHVHTQR